MTRKQVIPHPDDEIDGITYDNAGRMKYHPDFHPNHNKSFTTDELEYICLYHKCDDMRSISYAIGRTENACRSALAIMKKDGQ